MSRLEKCGLVMALLSITYYVGEGDQLSNFGTIIVMIGLILGSITFILGSDVDQKR